MIPVTVVILTKNEEINIGPCLDSCAWCDDVHVLDSGSTDATIEIAQARGIKVHFHPFQSFGLQRNWAINNIEAKNEWHFHLDADERFTPELIREIQTEIGSDGATSTKAAYFVASKLIFFGRWLRYSSAYPTYQVRLFHKKRCQFIDFGHGQRENTIGEIGTLCQPYLHFNFSKGLTEWIEKHNRYSTLEAFESINKNQSKVDWRNFFSSDKVQRRRTLKNIAYKMPGKALLRFLFSYLWRSGWRDGVPGFHYCFMISFYEYLIQLKTYEIKIGISK